MGTERIETDGAITDASAAAVRAATGDSADLTVLRDPGGDDGGLHRALADRRYREIGLEQLASVSGRTLLLDARSGPGEWTPRALAIAERRFDHVIALMPPGAGSSERRDVSLALRDVGADHVMLVDPATEPSPAAIERLSAELEAHPDALGVAARVVDPSGVTLAYGGDLREWHGVVEFRPARADAALLPARCDWVAGHALMIRAATLKELPLDRALGAGIAREWSYRAAQQARLQPFLYCPDAVVVSAVELPGTPPRAALDADFGTRCRALAHLELQARFYTKHRLVPGDVFEILPSLPGRDAASTLLTLLDELGGDRFLELWAGGRLDPLLADADAEAAHADELAALEATLAGTRAELADTRRRLGSIESTRAWRLATGYYRLREAARRS